MSMLGIAFLNEIVRRREILNSEQVLNLLRKNTTKYNLQTIKGDRMPIGIYRKEKNFTSKIIELQDNDTIYLFSDGYPDQFSSDRKKFTTKRFKELIIDMQEKNMQEQKHILSENIEQWKGYADQLDDILVLGVKINFT